MGGDPEGSFGDFVTFAATTPNHHWLPQSWYVPERVKYLGKIEHFDEDFSRLLNLLGISKEFGRLNAVERKDY
jgi:hypothetical protein